MENNKQQGAARLDAGTESIFKVVGTDEITGSLKTAGKSVFKFMLENEETGRIAILFFNATKTKSGHKVDHNGKFACFYRLTLGENPKSRYSKAQQLRSHFHGYAFKCVTEEGVCKKGDCYTLITKATPLNPILKDEWTIAGRLKGKSRRRNLGSGEKLKPAVQVKPQPALLINSVQTQSQPALPISATQTQSQPVLPVIAAQTQRTLPAKCIQKPTPGVIANIHLMSDEAYHKSFSFIDNEEEAEWLDIF